jgi:hypothetical protein
MLRLLALLLLLAAPSAVLARQYDWQWKDGRGEPGWDLAW